MLLHGVHPSTSVLWLELYVLFPCGFISLIFDILIWVRSNILSSFDWFHLVQPSSFIFHILQDFIISYNLKLFLGVSVLPSSLSTPIFGLMDSLHILAVVKNAAMNKGMRL